MFGIIPFNSVISLLCLPGLHLFDQKQYCEILQLKRPVYYYNSKYIKYNSILIHFKM